VGFFDGCATRGLQRCHRSHARERAWARSDRPQRGKGPWSHSRVEAFSRSCYGLAREEHLVDALAVGLTEACASGLRAEEPGTNGTARFRSRDFCRQQP
jgi:hypothetical protein